MNDWLSDVLEVFTWSVRNRHTESELTITSSDAPSSYGLTPDFIIIDELSHWQSRDLFDSLFSAAAKRADCLLIVISNAGLGKGSSWQWKVHEGFRERKGCYFSRLDGPVASWITADRLAEQADILPGKAYARLWLNEWQTEAGDVLDQADLLASVLFPASAHLPTPGPLDGPNPERSYIGGLDIGTRRDFSAFVILESDPVKQRVRLAREWEWRPSTATGQVCLQTIENVLIAEHHRWRLSGIVFDPWQAEFLAQRLRQRGLHMIEHPFTAANMNRMATALIEIFKSRRIDLFKNCKLFDQLHASASKKRFRAD